MSMAVKVTRNQLNDSSSNGRVATMTVMKKGAMHPHSLDAREIEGRGIMIITLVIDHVLLVVSYYPYDI